MEKLRHLVDRLFPERQLFVRTEGRVRYLRFPQGLQVGISVVVLAGALWIAFASLMYAVNSRHIAENNARIDRQQFVFEKLSGQIAAYQDEIVDLSRTVQERQAHLLEIMEKVTAVDKPVVSAPVEAGGGPQQEPAVQQKLAMLDDGLRAVTGMWREIENNLAATLKRLDSAVAEQDEAATAYRGVWDRLQSNQEALRRATDHVAVLQDELAVTKPRLETALAERDRAMATRQELSEAYEIDREQLTRATELASVLREDLGTVGARLEKVSAENQDNLKIRNVLRARVNALEQVLNDATALRQRALSRLAVRTADGIERIERLIEYTRLDKEKWMAAAGVTPIGQGGPFIAVDPSDGLGDVWDSPVALFATRLERWQVLERLLERLPLGAPVTSFYVSSRFGLRTDPYTKNRSMHSGVDLAGQLNSTIYAPAPGVVTVAGRNGPNGKMIEIDHGMNIFTRYGHLSRILVEKGQKIGFRNQIAAMGTTGRSTGPHLHYEISVNGRTYDPLRFIEAGRYLLHDLPVVKPVKLLHPVKPKPIRRVRG